MNAIDRNDLESAIEAPCEAYPKTFFMNARLRRPLKLDIVKDIKADLKADPDSELKFYDIDQALEWYCGHAGYYRTCSIAGAARINLAGTKVGTVTEAEARYAAKLAAEGFAQIEARKRSSAYVAPSNGPAVSAPRVLKVDATLNEEGLLASIEKHITTLRSLTSLPDPDLQRQLSRTVVLLLIDELKILDARLST
jgi:sRNA-binding protein